ncbi:MAG: hypothetical protein ACXQT5_04005, partial [Candidatus Syntropharchaeia archaeon]
MELNLDKFVEGIGGEYGGSEIRYNDEFDQYKPKIIEYLAKRGWDKKIAKMREGRQTILEHVLIELDALRNLLFLLQSEYGFSKKEMTKLLLAVIAHDANKETNEFQEYIHGRGDFVPCTNEDISREIILDLSKELGLGLDIKDIEEINSWIVTHMSKERKKPTTAFAQVKKKAEGKISESWKKLATLVWFTDDLCSCSSISQVFGTLKLAEYGSLGEMIRLRSHRVHRNRGITTSLLHTAVKEAHIMAGKLPLLYFAEGTVYAELKSEKRIVREDHIKERLIKSISTLISNLEDNLPPLVVGQPNASPISAKRFFQFSKLDKYLDHLIKQERRKKSDVKDLHLKEYIYGKILHDISGLDLVHKYFGFEKKKRIELLKENGIDP